MKSDERTVMPIILGELRKLIAINGSKEIKCIEDKLSREVIRKNFPKGDIEPPTEIPIIQ
jgi:hypothetical protein